MKKLGFLLAILFFTSFAFAAGLSKTEIESIKQKAMQSKSSWSGQQTEEHKKNILEDLGMDAEVNDDGEYEGADIYSQELKPGATTGFTLRRQGEENFNCSSNEIVNLANLKLKIIDCNLNEELISFEACDSESFGLACNSKSTYKGELSLNKTQVIQNASLKGAYQIEASCLEQSCLIKYKAVYQQNFSAHSAQSMAEGEQALAEHSGKGTVLDILSGISKPEDPELQAIRKDVQDSKASFVECYIDRMNELEDDGKVKQSCDPSDVRTFDFLIDKREGDNFGNMMCDRSEEGSCKQPIKIHERLDHEGEQVCVAEYENSLETCRVYTPIKIVTTTGNADECGEGCIDVYFGSNQVPGWGATHAVPGQREEHFNFTIKVNNTQPILSVELFYMYFDRWVELYADGVLIYRYVEPGKNFSNSSTNVGQSCQTAGNSNYNNSVYKKNITNIFKNKKNGDTVNLFLKLKTPRGGGQAMGALRLKYAQTVFDGNPNCKSQLNRPVNSDSVAGCYEVNKTCQDPSFSGKDDSDCWEMKKEYLCIGGSQLGCNQAMLQNSGWVQQKVFDTEYPTSISEQDTSQAFKWKELWTYEGSNNFDTSLGCAPSFNTENTDATGGTINTTHTWCYQEPPKECNPSPPETAEEITKCRVDTTQCLTEDKGLCVLQQQDYSCETAYVCKTAFDNSMEDASVKPDNAGALAKVIAEHKKAQILSDALQGNAIEDENGNLTIFNGQLHQCNKWHSKVFTYLEEGYVNDELKMLIDMNFGGLSKKKRNCCEGLPDDIGLIVNADNCKQEDIELAAKRLAKAAHLLQLDGSTPVASGSVLLGDKDLQDASVAYGKKRYNIQVSRTCSSWSKTDANGVRTCLAYNYTVNPSFNLAGYTQKNWPDTNLAGLNASFKKLLQTNAYHVEQTQAQGIPTRVFQNTLYDPTCGANGCDRIIETDPDGKDYFVTTTCPGEYSDAGELLNQPTSCKVYPNEEELDLVGADDFSGSGNWLPGKYEACAFFWKMHRGALPGKIEIPGNRRLQEADNMLQKLIHKPHVCQEYINEVVTRIPVDSYQSWCTFDDPFARIVQEQGRKQLALYATRPETGSVTDTIKFSFYTPIAGQWTPPKIINNQDIRFWQWPAACTNPEFEAQSFLTNQACPQNADVYVAICEENGKCGALPANPVLQMSSKWETRRLRAEDSELQTLTPLLVLQGNCTESGNCAYNLHAWKKGMGGTVEIPIDMSWKLEDNASGWSVNYASHNQLHLMAYTAPKNSKNENDIFDFEIGVEKAPGEINNSPKLKMCIGSPAKCDITKPENKEIWENVLLETPTALAGQVINDPLEIIETEIIPAYTDAMGVEHPRKEIHKYKGGIDVRAIGQCKGNNCEYRVLAKIKLELKPWHRGVTYDKFTAGIKPKVLGKYLGGKKSQNYNHRLIEPDCSGFNLDQFLALNIGAMDFREFTDILAEEALAELEKSGGANSAKIDEDIEKILSGEATQISPTGTKNFRIFPDNGYPGETVEITPLLSRDDTIVVSKNKENKLVKAYGYKVDWGDGKNDDENYTYSLHNKAKHTYGTRTSPQPTRLITGKIYWNTEIGVVAESFTYKMWTNPNDTGGGGQIGAGNAPGTTNAIEAIDSPIKQFNELENELRQLDQSTW